MRIIKFKGEKNRRRKRKIEKNNERKETRSIRKNTEEKRDRENSNGTLDATLNLLQNSTEKCLSASQQTATVLISFLSVNLSRPFLLFSSHFLLLLIPLLTHMVADLYLLPIKRAELDRFKKKSQNLFEYTKKNPCVDRRLKAREEFFQLEAVLASRYPFSSSVWIFSSLMRCRWKLGIEHFKFQMLFEIQTENYVL